MHSQLLSPRTRLFGLVIALAMLLMALPGVAFAQAKSPSASGGYQRINLVSDLNGVAEFTDPNLINPWGLASSPTSPWWISDNNSGLSTLYNGQGATIPLVVKIPAPKGSSAGTMATPTGLIFNPTTTSNPGDFVVSQNGVSGPSIFIFSTEDGTISGWNPGVNLKHAVRVVDRSTVGTGAVYKGLAFAQSGGSSFIYATNIRFGSVEQFDAHFQLVRSFTDNALANTCPLPNQCYSPFGIQNIGGNLYVTFALQNAAHDGDMGGAHRGFVDVFSPDGNLLHRLIAHGNLDSPWGLALAPSNFGQFSNDLFVGNFGDGAINVYDPNTGAFIGQPTDGNGNPIAIDDLWALQFGNGAAAGATNQLFFTAGIGDEEHGLFGYIQSLS